jgi:pyruvate-ferredoxin/flavodoxin oxidoreductase
VDSGTIVALMHELGVSPIRTFTIGFEEKSFSEADTAREVATRYGTEHHELIVRPDAIALLPKLVRHFDEPFADSSAIPVWYVSELARRHVTVVLCCDPKAFTHTNPLDGMSEGGCLIWESEESGKQAWTRLPIWARQQIIQKKIRVFTLPGFEIARKATDRGDLQLRMQGNAFLGAFFSVSPMLAEFGITPEQFRDAVHKQYVKKFGKLGDAVVVSNMEVMTKGFELVREIKVGEMEAADRSTLRGKALLPMVMPDSIAASEGCSTGCRTIPPPEDQPARPPLTRVADFDAMFRAKLGYNQPANAYASLGIMAAGSGDTASKYVARRETPLYIPENCTQCMECIAVCPDTALPNCSQDLDTILHAAVSNYVSDGAERQKMLKLLPEITKQTRERMREAVAKNDKTPAQTFIREVTHAVNGFSPAAKEEFFSVIDKVPMAFHKANAIFATPEKKNPGSGGIFSIFVSDLCKGCAACVTACGEHRALRMVQETEEVNAEHETGTAFLDLLPQLGLTGKAVLPLAVGGSIAHVLAIDYGLRPVLCSMAAEHASL